MKIKITKLSIKSLASVLPKKLLKRVQLAKLIEPHLPRRPLLKMPRALKKLKKRQLQKRVLLSMTVLLPPLSQSNLHPRNRKLLVKSRTLRGKLQAKNKLTNLQRLWLRIKVNWLLTPHISPVFSAICYSLLVAQKLIFLNFWLIFLE